MNRTPNWALKISLLTGTHASVLGMIICRKGVSNDEATGGSGFGPSSRKPAGDTKKGVTCRICTANATTAHHSRPVSQTCWSLLYASLVHCCNVSLVAQFVRGTRGARGRGHQSNHQYRKVRYDVILNPICDHVNQ